MKLLENCETKWPGLFTIYIEDDIIYKKIKDTNYGKSLTKNIKKKETNLIKYRDFIENSHTNEHYGKHAIKGYDVENDGSYKCDYIEGYRLDKLKDNIDDINETINVDILIKINEQINVLKNDLAKHKDFINGDWDVHNLIYSIRDNIIYNVDLEGFYNAQMGKKDCMVNNVNWINKKLNAAYKSIENAIKTRT